VLVLVFVFTLVLVLELVLVLVFVTEVDFVLITTGTFTFFDPQDPDKIDNISLRSALSTDKLHLYLIATQWVA
jgi:hypothetical protein